MRGNRRLGLSLLALVLVLSACSDSEGATPAAPTELIGRPPPTSSPLADAATALPATPVPIRPEPTPVVEGRYGGVLNLVSRDEVAHQDVHQDLSPSLSTWGPGIAYSRLMRFRSGEDVKLPSLDVECEVCESWWLEDERTLVFQLREDVRWQDFSPVNGRLLTSADLVFSYDRQRLPGMSNAPLLAGIETLEAPQSHLLRISMSARDADFMAALADARSKIVAREAVALLGDLRGGPTVGTGPWILDSSRPRIAHSFSRNPDYFEDGLPFVDRLTFHIIPDPETRDAAFQVGSLDVHQPEPAQWESLSARRPGAPVTFLKEPGSGVEVALRTTTPPFDDPVLREAAFLAMDPWKAIDDIWGGFGFVSLGAPVADPGWLLAEDELRQLFARPRQAREVFGAAGPVVPVPVTIKVGDFGDGYLEHARLIAGELAKVGFGPVLEVVNRRRFGEEVWLGGDYQMFVGPPAPTTTPNGYLLPVLHSRGLWNTTGHRDEELDRLIETQAGELNATARRDLALQIQRRVLGGAYRFMPATRVAIWTWSPRLQNFHPNFAGAEYGHWSRVWLDD